MNGAHKHLNSRAVSIKFFWLLWVLYAVVYMAKNCYSAAMAAIVREGIFTKSQTGLITAAFYAVYAPLQIVGGIFADKYNPERMIKIGLVGGGIANLIIFFNQNYYVMLAAWVFNALAQFAVWPSIFKIVSSQLEPSYRATGVYYITMTTVFGLVLSYLVAAVVTKWQYNFLVSAVMLLGYAVLFHIGDLQAEKYMVPGEAPRPEAPDAGAIHQTTSPVKLFLASGFMLLVLAHASWWVISNSVKTLSATLLLESYDQISPSVGNLLNALIIVAGLAGVFLVNRFLYPRLIRHEAVAWLVLGCAVAAPIMVMSFVGKISIGIFIAALFLASLLLSGQGIITARARVVFAKYGMNGVATGIDNSAVGLAFVVNNYAVVKVADSMGWRSAIYFLLILLAFTGVCLAAAIPLWARFKNKAEGKEEKRR